MPGCMIPGIFAFIHRRGFQKPIFGSLPKSSLEMGLGAIATAEI